MYSVFICVHVKSRGLILWGSTSYYLGTLLSSSLSPALVLGSEFRTSCLYNVMTVSCNHRHKHSTGEFQWGTVHTGLFCWCVSGGLSSLSLLTWEDQPLWEAHSLGRGFWTVQNWRNRAQASKWGCASLSLLWTGCDVTAAVSSCHRDSSPCLSITWYCELK